MRKISLLLAVLLILGCVIGCRTNVSAQENDSTPQKQVEVLQEENAALQQKVTDQQKEIATLKKQATELQRENAALKQQLEDLQQPAKKTSSVKKDVPADTDTFDVSETEIHGGTNQADAMQLPMNTKVYGTLHDAQNMYLSFHTGPSEKSTYRITVIHKTLLEGNAKIAFYVLDEYGTELGSQKAYDDGIASTLDLDELKPDTDYYIRLIVEDSGISITKPRSDTVHFALTIRDTLAQAEGVDTTNSLLNAIVPQEDIEDLVVGTNQDDAALIPFDKTVSGELKDAIGGWYAFATADGEESSYLISALDKSTDNSVKIGFYVFDEYGAQIAYDKAFSDGITKTITLDDLHPNTVYYIRLIVEDGGISITKPKSDTVDYDLTVRRQDNTTEANTATVEEAEEAVFETPFELSSTQVRFVANQAVFIDEDEAKEALAPVAEIILAHPEHPILLAGTTATYGSQEDCINLSDRRAAAVKDLLVNHFGVSEAQLITVGLGYENDPFVRGRDVDSNGNFVESEGAKNRRVVVLDAESETAQQILGN